MAKLYDRRDEILNNIPEMDEKLEHFEAALLSVDSKLENVNLEITDTKAELDNQEKNFNETFLSRENYRQLHNNLRNGPSENGQESQIGNNMRNGIQRRNSQMSQNNGKKILSQKLSDIKNDISENYRLKTKIRNEIKRLNEQIAKNQNDMGAWKQKTVLFTMLQSDRDNRLKSNNAKIIDLKETKMQNLLDIFENKKRIYANCLEIENLNKILFNNVRIEEKNGDFIDAKNKETQTLDS